MTVKEKAERYDKALEIARQYWNNRAMPIGTNFQLQRMFPELKESEDEKIKKDLIIYLRSVLSNKKYGDKFIESWIAWLENQGQQKPVVIIPKFRVGDEIKTSNEESLTITKIDEKGYWSEDLFICGFDEECIWDLVGQKHVDRIEPKFKVGDWIVYKDNIWKICNISLGTYYELLKTNNEVIIRHFEGVDKTAHLWTIQDAKDGDVLVSSDASYIVLFKELSCLEDNIDRFKSYCHRFRKGTFCPIEDPSWGCNAFHPATKEQCDVLMKTMADAKYTFDFEKKELKKIEQEKKNMDNKLTNFEHSLKHIMEEAIECGDTHNLKADADMLLRLAQKSNEWHREDEQNLNAWTEGDEKQARQIERIVHNDGCSK